MTTCLFFSLSLLVDDTTLLSLLLSLNSKVRRAGSSVYHLACFACDLCQRQLSTGEQFTIDTQSGPDSKLLCKLHFGINNESGGSAGDSHDSSSNDSTSSSSLKPSKTKRVRTTFTEEQLQVLQANFQVRIVLHVPAKTHPL